MLNRRPTMSGRKTSRLAAAAKRLRGDRRGVSAIEFVLIFPLLVGLLAGTVDFGQALMVSRKMDQIVGTLEDGSASGFSTVKADAFFKMVRTDIIEGMFGDPAYGGNRNKAGWRLINYPGAQRGYTVEDMHTETSNREPQSLAEMHAYMEQNEMGGPAIQPVSNADSSHHLTEHDRVNQGAGQ